MPVTVPLRLIPSSVSQPVRAGYLPGSEVGAWLAEMARHEQARFFIVPGSIEDAEAGGLLILGADAPSSKNVFGPRVMPCAVEHGCVVVPASTRLDPLLAAEEVGRLLPYHLYFFHPALGLVAFEEGDCIRPDQLIVPPLSRQSSWMAAMPGNHPPPCLSRILLTLPEDPADLFGSAANDIGSQSPKDLQKKAPLMERLGDMLGNAGAGVGIGLLVGLGGLAKMLGAGKVSTSVPPPFPGQSGHGKEGQNPPGFKWLDQLQNWTAKQFEKLQEQRENEIQRLLRLLEKNPEEGLRYALPLDTGGDAARGQAPPSRELGLRDPTFNHRRSGGPVDAWNFSDKARWNLQTKYRELANRELAEGRYDRAAYIFGELLGDWHAAAGALARGKRYQEATRVYIDRLNNRLLAAKCLEDAGLLTEAVLLYAELEQHEKCGDLLRRLGREREAVAAYQEAIKGSTDRLHDARILFEKLEQHSLALSVLASGYPNTTQAKTCLEKHFDYLNRLEAHDEAVALSYRLGDPGHQIQKPLIMAQALEHIHAAYSEPRVQGRLATVALEVIGWALDQKPEKDVVELLKLLPKFAPSDRLLNRDTGRFQDRFLHEQRALVKTASPTFMLAMNPKSRFQLARDGTEWRSLFTRDSRWLVSGHHVRTGLDVWVSGEETTIQGKLTSAVGWESNLMLPALIPPMPKMTWLPLAPKGQEARYGETQGADFTFVPRSRELLLARLNWMPKGVLAIHAANEGAWILHLNRTETIDLSFYGYEGRLLRTHALGWAPPSLALPVLMAVHDEEVFVSAGPHLLLIKHGHIYHQLELNGRVVHLAVSRPVQPAVALIVAGDEAMLMTPGKKGETIQLHSGNLLRACFLADGRIAVGEPQGLLIYSPYPQAKLLHTIPLHREADQFVESLAAWGSGGLAILWTDGLVECYE